MHIPKQYRSDDITLMKKIINENAFATLISSKDMIRTTHAIFYLKESGNDFLLETHISRANPQAKILENSDNVLCDFLGNHTYISSSWYDHTNVSTWNYEAVQIRGKVKLMNDDELFDHLSRVTEIYESHQKCPMLVQKMGEDFARKEMKGAFGIKIIPQEIHIAQKLSQNRKDNDYHNIISQLENSDNDDSKKIAEAMKKLRS